MSTHPCPFEVLEARRSRIDAKLSRLVGMLGFLYDKRVLYPVTEYPYADDWFSIPGYLGYPLDRDRLFEYGEQFYSGEGDVLVLNSDGTVRIGADGKNMKTRGVKGEWKGELMSSILTAPRRVFVDETNVTLATFWVEIGNEMRSFLVDCLGYAWFYDSPHVLEQIIDPLQHRITEPIQVPREIDEQNEYYRLYAYYTFYTWCFFYVFNFPRITTRVPRAKTVPRPTDISEYTGYRRSVFAIGRLFHEYNQGLIPSVPGGGEESGRRLNGIEFLLHLCFKHAKITGSFPYYTDEPQEGSFEFYYPGDTQPYERARAKRERIMENLNAFMSDETAIQRQFRDNMPLQVKRFFGDPFVNGRSIGLASEKWQDYDMTREDGTSKYLKPTRPRFGRRRSSAPKKKRVSKARPKRKMY